MRVIGIVVERELDERAHRFPRLQLFELELGLSAANFLVHTLKHRQIELLVVSEIVIDHALIRARPSRDCIDTSAADSLGGKFDGGRLEYQFARSFRVSPPRCRRLSRLGGQMRRSHLFSTEY